MKLLIFFAVLVAFGAFLYWRLRPYIAAARRVLGVVRDVRRVSTPEHGATTATTGRTPSLSEKLVRCLSCGTWIPETRALSPGRRRGASNNNNNYYYCSHACLERAAEGRQPRAASGNPH
ncbi:MAG TPA: hypothetical protein VGX92_21835 [Pyrinomonadaceae bacterium]|nr:hypothetical protein [Pyrinomonadaceae bacterium]